MQKSSGQTRVSVRALVEFTLHGADITPCGSLKDRYEGQLGHKARQKLLGDEWQCEKSLTYTHDLGEEGSLIVTGRMDAFFPGTPPIIEQIKLWQHTAPPQAAREAHLAQAVCYGHMLCLQQSLPGVLLRVAYVSREGAVAAVFEQMYSAAECAAQFERLLFAYTENLCRIRKHLHERDRSLAGLVFPYPAWRPGQRDMAAAVYSSIRHKRRLFASMPTGCGKSTAALFPALKALATGATKQIYYLTARTTQRQGPIDALELLSKQPLCLWVLVLDAKEKQCPDRTVCHPDWCPRAKGHFLRDAAARAQIENYSLWTPELIREIAQKHCLCPFEFSLSLAEIADVTICDYNYALDPAVHIQRIFDRSQNITLLIDEAHHLSDRTREMLSGSIDEGAIRKLRTVCGKYGGRKHPIYAAMTDLLKAFSENAAPEGECVIPFPPAAFYEAAEKVSALLPELLLSRFPWDEAGERLTEVWRSLNGFLRSQHAAPGSYACISQGKKTKKYTALALDLADHLCRTTKDLSGVICFSATLDPLWEMKRLLGGEKDDLCLSVPSPFPRENLLVIREDVNTRYAARAASAEVIAQRIQELQALRPGKYIVFFPSFSYMRMVDVLLPEGFQRQVQQSAMTDAERAAFLAPYREGRGAVTALCVMGGIFSEGIDLPGRALDGVVIVGVGLPQVNIFQDTLRDGYEATLGNGFFYAYQIPGMQKVAQAAGRVIRTETDRGIVLLLDDRFALPQYRQLCPPHWQIRHGDTAGLIRDFARDDLPPDD